MTRNHIPWCEYTWDPVTGCRYGCRYCRALRGAKRMGGDIRLNMNSPQLKQEPGGLFRLESPFVDTTGRVIPLPAGFEPTLHQYRLIPSEAPEAKMKPSRVYVCNQADLFGEWVPDDWIEQVFQACERAPWHNYLFLTRNPTRYKKLADSGMLRTGANYWYGTTITGPGDPVFLRTEINAFACIEPIVEPFHAAKSKTFVERFRRLRWVILGAEVDNAYGKVIPEISWLEDIRDACKAAGTPLLVADNPSTPWPGERPQEYPEELLRPAGPPVPHCRKCSEHQATERFVVQGIMHMNHVCRATGLPIKARYLKSCPPECPKRGNGSQ